jgi:formyltetrahydrofolate synthetase
VHCGRSRTSPWHNSLLADTLALQLADIVVTEAASAPTWASKFVDIACRVRNLDRQPSFSSRP